MEREIDRFVAPAGRAQLGPNSAPSGGGSGAPAHPLNREFGQSDYGLAMSSRPSPYFAVLTC